MPGLCSVAERRRCNTKHDGDKPRGKDPAPHRDERGGWPHRPEGVRC